MKSWEDRSYEDVNTFLGGPKSYELVDLTTRLDAYLRLRSHVMLSLYTKTNLTTWSSTPGIFQQGEVIVSNVETIESYKSVDPVPWLEADPISRWNRFTTANTELKDFTQYLQRQAVLDQFAALTLQENNWDEYESKIPTDPILAHAKLLIEELLNSISSAGYLWITPFISTDEDGYITVEWHKGNRELHFDIEENEAEYTKISGPNTNMKIQTDFLNRDDYLTLWKWLLDG